MEINKEEMDAKIKKAISYRKNIGIIRIAMKRLPYFEDLKEGDIVVFITDLNNVNKIGLLKKLHPYILVYKDEYNMSWFSRVGPNGKPMDTLVCGLNEGYPIIHPDIIDGQILGQDVDVLKDIKDKNKEIQKVKRRNEKKLLYFNTNKEALDYINNILKEGDKLWYYNYNYGEKFELTLRIDPSFNPRFLNEEFNSVSHRYNYKFMYNEQISCRLNIEHLYSSRLSIENRNKSRMHFFKEEPESLPK